MGIAGDGRRRAAQGGCGGPAARRADHPAPPADDRGACGAGPDAAETLIGHETQQKIDSAILRLPPQCRTVFQLSRLEGLKYQEIANHMGISIKTVETQMTRALKQLRVEVL
ncbi:MAG: sigma-70 family RNA polymerase sigma factor [Hylemonella sp.]